MAEEKKKENPPNYFTYEASKPKRPFHKRFAHFIWNGETKEICGRTLKRWFHCLIFYIIFYVVLFAFFYLNYYCFTITIDERTPYWQLGDSVISTSPGLSFRPKPPEENVNSVFIWTKPGPNGDARYWSKQLNKFLKDYHSSNDSVDCSANKSSEANCSFSLGQFGPHCNSANQFGYADGRPCIFIKINKIFGWKPQTYSEGNMPGDLVKQLPKNFKGDNMIYLTCTGESKAEEENVGELEYFPGPGFSSKYFPYLNQRGYQAPLVAIHFKNATRGIPIGVECRAWAKNIEYNRPKKMGCVSLDLLIDF